MLLDWYAGVGGFNWTGSCALPCGKIWLEVILGFAGYLLVFFINNFWPSWIFLLEEVPNYLIDDNKVFILGQVFPKNPLLNILKQTLVVDFGGFEQLILVQVGCVLLHPRHSKNILILVFLGPLLTGEHPDDFALQLSPVKILQITSHLAIPLAFLNWFMMLSMYLSWVPIVYGLSWKLSSRLSDLLVLQSWVELPT